MVQEDASRRRRLFRSRDEDDLRADGFMDRERRVDAVLDGLQISITDFPLLDTTAVRRRQLAVHIGPHLRMAVVGTPGYFAGRGKRETPQDLSGHTCLNLRLSTLGGIYAWEFEKDGRELRVRVDGRPSTMRG